MAHEMSILLSCDTACLCLRVRIAMSAMPRPAKPIAPPDMRCALRMLSVGGKKLCRTMR